jgi:mannose/fructose/N-acetylgalactosamine-specific phosphotransferase system component IIC
MGFPEPAQWIAFAALAAFVALDSGPWLLSMAARPLPAATLLGLLWGDPAGGALVGAALELVYAGILPVGASRYPDAGLAGLVGAGVSLWAAPLAGAPTLPLALLLGLLAGHAGRGIETWRRSLNAVWVAGARAAAAAGDPAAIGRVNARAMAFAALLGAGSAVALLGLALFVAAPLVDAAPALAAPAPPLALFAALGCGAALRLWAGWAPRLWLAAGLVAGLAAGQLVPGLLR